MTFPRYSIYKDSGVTWLGGIPAHWDIKKFRYVFEESPEKITDEVVGEMLSVSGYRGIEVKHYDDEGRRRTDDELFGYRVVRPGQLVVNTMWLNYAGLGVSDYEGHVSPAYRSYWIDSAMDKRFTHHLMRSGTYVQGYTQLLTGIRPNSLQMGRDDLMVFPVLLPARVEQTQIARFLDHETARIDALIEEQQRLIELLKEKRQAVISHAVTKGLDPTVPMKDSGVEWLGEVPAHWKQIRIKHILNAMIDAEHKTAEYSDDGEYLVCRTTNVRNGLLSLEGAKYADRNTYIDWTRRGVPEPLDILFTREAPAGEACLVPENLEICLGQRMVLFKLDKTRIDPAFTVHSIYAGLASDFVKQLSQGSTVSHFNMADIGNIPLFEPPLPEQKEISDFLARRCDSYGLLINEAESSVKLISERRSALISAAVTGKIDVRGWQPPASAPTPELVQEAV